MRNRSECIPYFLYHIYIYICITQAACEEKIERKGDIPTSHIITETGRREKEKERYCRIFWLTTQQTIGDRLLSVHDAIDHPANDWLSTLGWSMLRDSQTCIRVTRTVCASLTAVKLVHRSFVWHKTPLEPVFRLANELEIGSPGPPSWIISWHAFFSRETRRNVTSRDIPWSIARRQRMPPSISFSDGK